MQENINIAEKVELASATPHIQTATEARTKLEAEGIKIARAEIPIGAFSNGPRVRRGPEEKVFLPRKLDKVIILGMGHSLFDWIHECYGEYPLAAEPGTEIWSINYSGFAMHSHVCFNMHDFDGDDNPEHRKIFEGYARMPNLKVVSVKSYDWLPNSYEYPLQEVMEDPYASVPYFTNSTSYLVALAIACRVKELKIYGCDFDYDEKFLDVNRFERGRANMEFWLGRASAYGCLLTIARHSSLLAASTIEQAHRIPFYGYGRHQPEFTLTEQNQPVMTGWVKDVPAVEEALKPGGDIGLG